jgi:predicted nucleic acid-binding protein
MTYLLDTCLISELVRQLERQGRSLPVIDSLIAAIALQHSLSLVTRNEGDFAGTGLTIVKGITQYLC